MLFKLICVLFCKQALKVDDVVEAMVYILSARPCVQVGATEYTIGCIACAISRHLYVESQNDHIYACL